MDLRAIARPCAIFSYLVHIIRDFQIGGLKIELGLGIDLGTQVGPPFAYLLTVDS